MGQILPARIMPSCADGGSEAIAAHSDAVSWHSAVRRSHSRKAFLAAELGNREAIQIASFQSSHLYMY